MAQQPLVVQGLHIIEASQSYINTPHSLGLLWTSDQERLTDISQQTQQTNVHFPNGIFF